MNVESQIAKENRITFASFADFFIADKSSSALLLFFTLGLSFLNPAPTTAFLPLFSALALFLCWNYRLKGWMGAFVACLLLFLVAIPAKDLLWHGCLHLSLMLNLLISSLAASEQERVESQAGAHFEESQKGWQAQLASSQSIACQREEEKILLEEEVKRWKEEAEQRRIEKQMEEKKVSLLQGDLDLYLEQKASLIAESYQARTQLREGEERWSLYEKEKERLVREHTAAVDEKKALESTVRKVEEEKETLNREYLAVNAAVKKLEEEKSLLVAELAALAEEKKRQVEIVPASPEEITTLQRAVAETTGQYNQLKMQFEEKSRVLSQTRKELFEAEGKIMVTQREEAASAIEGDLSEVKGLQEDLRKTAIENERLEEQVNQLEELISRILAP